MVSKLEPYKISILLIVEYLPSTMLASLYINSCNKLLLATSNVSLKLVKDSAVFIEYNAGYVCCSY